MVEYKKGMKVIAQNKSHILIRFDIGDEVISLLREFCVKENIRSGVVSAIGACRKVELGFYHLSEKKYSRQLFEGEFEILGVQGNISWADSDVVIHAHGSFGKKDFSVIGGHIFNLEASPTCELALQIYPNDFKRAYNDKVGLKLLD